ncbi:hypothetical protein CRE_06594 [Caenorhabditis remanei]|nr:hypothetical protein CRE_06594 [Caenorhabditis remanei]
MLPETIHDITRTDHKPSRWTRIRQFFNNYFRFLLTTTLIASILSMEAYKEGEPKISLYETMKGTVSNVGYPTLLGLAIGFVLESLKAHIFDRFESPSTRHAHCYIAIFFWLGSVGCSLGYEESVAWWFRTISLGVLCFKYVEVIVPRFGRWNVTVQFYCAVATLVVIVSLFYFIENSIPSITHFEGNWRFLKPKTIFIIFKNVFLLLATLSQHLLTTESFDLEQITEEEQRRKEIARETMIRNRTLKEIEDSRRQAEEQAAEQQREIQDPIQPGVASPREEQDGGLRQRRVVSQ